MGTWISYLQELCPTVGWCWRGPQDAECCIAAASWQTTTQPHSLLSLTAAFCRALDSCCIQHLNPTSCMGTDGFDDAQGKAAGGRDDCQCSTEDQHCLICPAWACLGLHHLAGPPTGKAGPRGWSSIGSQSFTALFNSIFHFPSPASNCNLHPPSPPPSSIFSPSPPPSPSSIFHPFPSFCSSPFPLPLQPCHALFPTLGFCFHPSFIEKHYLLR